MKKADEIVRKLYIIWAFLLFVLLADQLAVLMEYYVTQDSRSYLEYYVVQLFYEASDLMTFGKIVIFGVLLLMFSVTMNATASATIVSTLAAILMFASRIKYVNRLEMVNYHDLALTEIANIAGGYIFIDFGKQLFVFLGIVLTICGVLLYIDISCKQWKKMHFTVKVRLIGGVLLLSCTVVTLSLYINSFNSKQNTVENMIESNSETLNGQYVVYRFLQNDGLSYGEEGVSESYKTLTELVSNVNKTETSDVRPNVIVIMAESWWDLDYIKTGSLTYNIDPMSIYHELQKKCVSGHVATEIYGGGTIVSESEFFTGINSYLAGSSVNVYGLLSTKDNATILSYFKQLDYKSVAIHPYYSDFYSRGEFYNSVGFDKTIFADDMDYKDTYDYFISDDSLANQIIYEYENKSDDIPLFVWSVTVGTHDFHLIYDDKTELDDYDYPIKAVWSDTGEEVDSNLKHIINGIYLSSAAYSKLIDYFENVDEPTVIVMYGDHSPSLDSYADKLGLEGNSLETTEKKYSTPILMWKNYDDGEDVDNFDNQNINYLAAKMLDFAGLPECRMSEFIKLYESQVNTYSANYIVDHQNNPLETITEEQKTVLQNLRVLWYDQINGKQYLKDLWDPIE